MSSTVLNDIVRDYESISAAWFTVLFPIADQPYGMRQGRVADPYGHHWLIGKPL